MKIIIIYFLHYLPSSKSRKQLPQEGNFLLAIKPFFCSCLIIRLLVFVHTIQFLSINDIDNAASLVFAMAWIFWELGSLVVVAFKSRLASCKNYITRATGFDLPFNECMKRSKSGERKHYLMGECYLLQKLKRFVVIQ